jgi:2-oxoglutarate ferredoxin oxidoreductase subunit beta
MTEQWLEQVVYQKPAALSDSPTHYCPGCTHGLIHKLIAEVIDELGIQERTIAVAPVGCAVFLYNYFELDTAVAAHGRAPAMATGLKRVQPDKIIFTYQGDGDLAAIGLAEIVWAATRGEKITVFFINNAIYGMTGGQMAPTSLPGQVTTSSPHGRDTALTGMPIHIAEMLAGLPGAEYVVRRSVHNIYAIKEAKKSIRTALRVQMAGAGFALVELLSSCPTNWAMTPVQALDWIEQTMALYYPVGDYKVTEMVKHLN